MQLCAALGTPSPPCGAHYSPDDCNVAAGCDSDGDGNSYESWCIDASGNHTSGPACESLLVPAWRNGPQPHWTSHVAKSTC